MRAELWLQPPELSLFPFRSNPVHFVVLRPYIVRHLLPQPARGVADCCAPVSCAWRQGNGR